MANTVKAVWGSAGIVIGSITMAYMYVIDKEFCRKVQ